eukprot:CAMPEP_0119046044 /NCGR_PEP_ID=MMETSP1177-20130426/44045_1 /TAXON_ID=2985 /ORGANISM="Ochromonas sp, Strain CCMP1899" /LENGTH=421 /DNA_ID=CAMNT_0007018647 /DNA_START=219 /DNA_END=1484 /DNA_ORIENTATION=+
MQRTVQNELVQNSTRLLSHLISYVEFQFGNRQFGKSYRERDGERVSNFVVEFAHLIPMYKRYIDIYERDKSVSELIRNDLQFPYIVRTLELLKPWSILLDSDPTTISKGLSTGQQQVISGSQSTAHQIDILFKMLSHTEANIANIYRSRYQYKLSENHCELAIAYAKRYVKEDKNKTDLLYQAYGAYSATKLNQFKYAEAATLAEECYNIVAIAYNPVHPDVQRAASILIQCLDLSEDQTNAERYAEMSLDSLRNKSHGVNQESEEVALGYYDLANTILRRPDGDLDRVEQLAREAYRIRNKLNDGLKIGASANLLANCLKAQGKLNEALDLYKLFLYISDRDQGPDSANASAVNANLSTLYSDLACKDLDEDTRNEHLCISKSYIKEAVRIARIVNCPGHSKTVDYEERLSDILILLPDA